VVRIQPHNVARLCLPCKVSRIDNLGVIAGGRVGYARSASCEDSEHDYNGDLTSAGRRSLEGLIWPEFPGRPVLCT